MRAGSRAAVLLLAAAAAVWFGARVSAHRLDELLQAARIGIDRDRVHLEMNLTPGTVVADRVIREIDADRNGVLSRDEEQAYAGRVLGELSLRIDDLPALHMQTTASRLPDLAALRAGDGAIMIRAATDVSRLRVGPHRLVFRNRNATANSVYLANALVPDDDDVAVTGQQRAGDQSELTIEFVVRERAASRRQSALLGLAGVFMLAASLTWGTRLHR